MNSILQFFTHFRELVSRGAYVFLANILEKATFFFLFLLFARSLPIEYFGLITASFAVANIMISLFEGGFNFYIQRAVASKEDLLLNRINQIFTLRIILIVPYLMLSLFYFIFFTHPVLLLSTIIILAIAFYSLNNLCNAIYFGLHRYKTVFLLLSVSRFVLVVAFIVARAMGKSPEFITATFLLSGIIHFIILLIALRKEGYKLQFTRIHFETIKTIFKSSLPMGMGIILVWVYDRADTVLIQSILGDHPVAFYAVAYSIYKAPQAFANIILTPLFTEFSGIFAQKGFIPKDNFLKKFLMLSLIAAVFTATVFFTAKIFILFFYRMIYINSVGLLTVLVFALPGLIWNNFTGITLNAAKKERLATFSVFIAVIVNLLLNTGLLLHYKNVYAAVAATVITEYLIFLIQLFYILKYKLLR